MPNNATKEYNLAVLNPELSIEWNYAQNGNLVPEMFTPNSSKKVWWICANGHEWEASIGNRNRLKSGCPFCHHLSVGEKKTKSLIKRAGSLADNKPELVNEWNYEKNGDLTPDMVTICSGKNVWWKCDKGHEWKTRVSVRTSQDGGCPVCKNKKVLPGYNDLLTLNINVANQWNYEKNGNLTPDMFTPNSGRKVWWKCDKGHEWVADIKSRNNGSGCVLCEAEAHTSFPEQAIYYYLSKSFSEIINSDTKEIGMEIDIFIPSIRTAIEYDGSFWHNDKEKVETKKNLLCIQNGIKLIRVREQGLKKYDNCTCIFRKNDSSDESLNEVIIELCMLLGIEMEVNIERDRIDILSQYVVNKKSNCLAYENPQVAEEWNYEKNGSLLPDMVSVRSGKKVWWKCKNGHEWQAVIAGRTDAVRHNNCPVCANKLIIEGINDLAFLSPKIVSYWNFDRNINVYPNMVGINSKKKVWWICEKGHEWYASIESNTRKNNPTICPICNGEAAVLKRTARVIYRKGSLLDNYPTISDEWNYEKNGKLTPDKVTPCSSKVVWWICEKGHEWEASIANRTNKRIHTKCPICSGKKVLVGYNDLASNNRQLSKEWNYKKNVDLTPERVVTNSHLKVWWICDKGHEWEATIVGRNRGQGCPVCANKVIVKGYNDLSTQRPDLAQEWNYEKNGLLSPEMVTYGSGRKVWWKCKNGHEWEATINQRSDKRSKGLCPLCSKQKRDVKNTGYP